MKKILAFALVALISMSFVFAQGGSETSTTSVVSESGFNTDQVLTFVIPGSTGGGTDLATRTMGEGLQRLYGLKINYQQMKNTIGHTTVKNAAADGNTIMLATAALLTQYVTGNSEVNPLEDLTLIACLDDNGYSVLAVPVDAPFNTFAEFVEYAKANPKKEFIVATEAGILHEMQRSCPDAIFYPVPPEISEGGLGCSCNECQYMKMNTLEKIYNTLKYGWPEVNVDPDIATEAVKPIIKMLELSK